MTPPWVEEIIDEIDRAVSNKAISKEELADGLEEIEDHAGEWGRQMREELGE
jgi:hypothetical protein